MPSYKSVCIVQTVSYLTHAYDVFDVVSAKDVQFLSDNLVLCAVCKQEEKPTASRAHEYKIVCRNRKRNKEPKVKKLVNHSVIAPQFLVIGL